mgnify:CR=1 FL=1
MVSNLELQNKIAILLVSHGSSLPFAEVTFNEIKDKFNKATGFATEVGYMKVAEPSIAGAVENLKEEILMNFILLLRMRLIASMKKSTMILIQKLQMPLNL